MLAEVDEMGDCSCEGGETLKGRGLGPGINFKTMPLGTYILQLGPTSSSFQNLQNYYHQLRHITKHRSLGAIHIHTIAVGKHEDRTISNDE